MTTFTIGSGGTYANWPAAISAVPSTLNDDYILSQVGDISQTTGYAISSWVTKNLNGYSLTIQNSSPHGGDPTQGYKTYANLTNLRLISLELAGSGSFEISGLNVIHSGAAHPLYIYDNYDNPGTRYVKVHDIIINGGGVAKGLLTVQSGLATGTCHVWNVICTNNGSTGIYSTAFLLLSDKPASLFVVENCVSCNHTLGTISGFCFDTTGANARNLVAFNNTGADFADHCSNGYNNASEDTSAQDSNWGTGSGNVTGITPANEFVSTDPTNADFVKVKTGGSCEAGGATPGIAGNTAGIRGNARPHSPDVSIGADEYAPSPSPQSGGGGGGNMLGVVMAALASGY